MFNFRGDQIRRERLRKEEEERAQFKQAYTRNLILIILSLGAVTTIFLFTRILAPIPQDPEAARIERILEEKMPPADFTVNIRKSFEPPEIEVNVLTDGPPEDIEAFIAGIQRIIYHEAVLERGFVTVRLQERLKNDGATSVASLAVRRTSISEIRETLEH
jgi:hypothetical protein